MAWTVKNLVYLLKKPDSVWFLQQLLLCELQNNSSSDKVLNQSNIASYPISLESKVSSEWVEIQIQQKTRYCENYSPSSSRKLWSWKIMKSSKFITILHNAMGNKRLVKNWSAGKTRNSLFGLRCKMFVSKEIEEERMQVIRCMVQITTLRRPEPLCIFRYHRPSGAAIESYLQYNSCLICVPCADFWDFF